jgi:hypothetical protein
LFNPRFMTAFEKLLSLSTAQGEVAELARNLIGKDHLAILIAKAALANTSASLSPTRVAEVLEINRSTAADRIDLASVRENGAKSPAF